MQILKWIGLLVLILVAAVAMIALIGARLPVKHTASRAATFKASPQQVWDAITGPPTWRPEVTRYEELPPHDGHRVWVEYGKADRKLTYEVVEAEPPRLLVTRIADQKLPFGGSWTYEIAPTDGGAMLVIIENGEVYNPIFRFLSRYVMGYTATMDSYLQALQKKLSSS